MLKIYNTLSRSKETFEALNPPFVGMYVCGPTVYDDPHLGHAKSYVSFDVVVRFLRFLDYKVRYVQNITDVGHLLGDEQDGEDRILKKARAEHIEPVEVAQKYENSYFKSMDSLNNIRPDISSRATGHIPEMLELVQKLLDKGYAYEADGDVYFDVRKFEGYGKLSGRKMDELREGVRVNSAEGKRFFADFALWKKADPTHLMQWNSPWSRGFPGWHLECSVMSAKYLGESFDIHGGGLDNQFPHHECEIAQSESANEKPFVKYWMHNNMVTVDGQKMSKSLGNFVTLEALFEQFSPMTVRFFILQGHYRSPQDFSDQALEAAGKGFDRLTRAMGALRQKAGSHNQQPEAYDEPWLTFQKRFIEFMEDDFSTSGAISVLFDMSRKIQESLDTESTQHLKQAEALFSALAEDVLGFDLSEQGDSAAGEMESELLDYIVRLRQKMREEKNWAASDEIRDTLAAMGVIIEDGSEGSSWQKK